MRRNYDTKLSASLLLRGKCGNYRDTGARLYGLALNERTAKIAQL